MVEKICDKTWTITKECKGDACDNITDQTYYYFKLPKADDYRKDTLTVRYVTRKVKRNVKTGKTSIESNVCNPTIGFFNSAHSTEKFSPIYVSDWSGQLPAQISFNNDSEFMLVKFDKDISRTYYYKLVAVRMLDN